MGNGQTIGKWEMVRAYEKVLPLLKAIAQVMRQCILFRKVLICAETPSSNMDPRKFE